MRRRLCSLLVYLFVGAVTARAAHAAPPAQSVSFIGEFDCNQSSNVQRVRRAMIDLRLTPNPTVASNGLWVLGANSTTTVVVTIVPASSTGTTSFWDTIGSASSFQSDADSWTTSILNYLNATTPTSCPAQ
jgi:hypothetical protein